MAIEDDLYGIHNTEFDLTMQTRKISLEHLLYALAFLLALGVRFLSLGDAPLSDFEAGWALQSWNAAQGNSVDIGPNPVYFSSTSLVFTLAEASNALARFWPALIGSFLVLVPVCFRRLLGRNTTLILAFGLALDPGLVAVSRLAGGPMLAIGFVILGMAFAYLKKPIWAGIFGGLALISGPSVLTGFLGLALAWGVGRLTGNLPGLAESDRPESTENQVRSTPNLREGLIFGLAAAILASTFFFKYPNGLGAWANTVPEYFKGWVSFSGIPVLQPLLALVFYQPLAFVLGLIATGRAWLSDEKLGRWLSTWFLAALLLATVYPGRQVYDVIWAILPLWSLAAQEFGRYLRKAEPFMAALGLAAAIFILSILFWVVSLNIAASNLTWLVLVIIPVLMILVVFLLGMGWSWEAARCGFIWGFSLSLGVYVISGVFGITHRFPNDPRILWTPPPGAVQVDLFDETLSELALIQNGRTDWLDIVSTVDRPSIRWVLRDYSAVQFVSTLDSATLPTVIITDDDQDLSQTMVYRGQDFTWSAYPGWPGAFPYEWYPWVTSRQAPLRYEDIILWARGDLFPENAAAGDIVEETTDDVQEDGGIE